MNTKKTVILGLTTEQLQEELERREKEKRETEKPQPLAEINMTRVRNICQEYIDALYDDGYASSSFSQYIFEAAVETVFGKDVWKWVNKQGRK